MLQEVEIAEKTIRKSSEWHGVGGKQALALAFLGRVGFGNVHFMTQSDWFVAWSHFSLSLACLFAEACCFPGRLATLLDCLSQEGAAVTWLV